MSLEIKSFRDELAGSQRWAWKSPWKSAKMDLGIVQGELGGCAFCNRHAGPDRHPGKGRASAHPGPCPRAGQTDLPRALPFSQPAGQFTMDSHTGTFPGTIWIEMGGPWHDVCRGLSHHIADMRVHCCVGGSNVRKDISWPLRDIPSPRVSENNVNVILLVWWSNPTLGQTGRWRHGEFWNQNWSFLAKRGKSRILDEI